MSERPTKERIINAAEDLMLAKSFHSVGLNEILKAVNVPKGSFYHHFKSKDEFGTELLKHYIAEASEFKRSALNRSSDCSDARQRILNYLQTGINCIDENNGKCPCLVMKLAAEVVNTCDGMRQEVARGQQQWKAIFKTAIQEAIDNEQIASDKSAENLSGLICYMWQGAMQLAITCKSTEPLLEAYEFIETSLLPAP